MKKNELDIDRKLLINYRLRRRILNSRCIKDSIRQWLTFGLVLGLDLGLGGPAP